MIVKAQVKSVAVLFLSTGGVFILRGQGFCYVDQILVVKLGEVVDGFAVVVLCHSDGNVIGKILGRRLDVHI